LSIGDFGGQSSQGIRLQRSRNEYEWSQDPINNPIEAGEETENSD
jgi:hypothetical protein